MRYKHSCVDRREQVPSLSGDPSPHTQKPPCVVLQVDDHDEVDDESENPSRHTRNKESSVVLLCDLQNGVHDDAKPPPFTKNKVPILEHKSEKASRRTDSDDFDERETFIFL